MSRWVVGAAGAAALILGACSPATNEVHEEQITPTQTREQVFIEQAHEAVPESRALDDDDLVEYGEVVCEALDAGITLPELALFIGYEVQNEEVAEMLGALGGTAVATLCPEVME